MKLYYHPVSTTSRPIMLLAADAGIDLEYHVVDLFKGEHMGEAYGAINPVKQVPVLEDGDFRLAESSAILKYLADKVGSPAYPTDLQKRARVNERMDWLNTSFYRDFGYGLVYPQCLPSARRDDPAVQAAILKSGREGANRWLEVLDKSIIGANSYLCGNELTIADYLAVGMLTLGEVVHLDYSKFPNVQRWLGTMKSRPTWEKVNEAFYTHFVGPYKDAKFEGL